MRWLLSLLLVLLSFNLEASYQDSYGQWHVKPTVDGIPSGNDGLILTAYARKLGLEVEDSKLWEMWEKLQKRGEDLPYPIERTPNNPTPYPSRDFFLGAVSFDLVSPESMEVNNWTFSPTQPPPRSYSKTLASFILAIGEHRNYLWEHDLEHSYWLMFSVPLADRAYYYRASNKTPPFKYQVAEWVDKNLTSASTNSGRLIRWLKYDEMPQLKVWVEYFGESHPFVALLKERGHE